MTIRFMQNKDLLTSHSKTLCPYTVHGNSQTYYCRLGSTIVFLKLQYITIFFLFFPSNKTKGSYHTKKICFMYVDMGDYFKKKCFHISFIFRKNNI